MRERIKALTKRRVIREGLWAAVGQVVSAAALLGGTRLITEMVRETSVMGTVNLLAGIVMFARGVACGPILQAQIRLYPDFAARGEVGRLRRIVTGIITPAVAALAGITLIAGAIHAWRTGASYWMYLALTVLLIVDTGRTLETNFFQAARRQKPITLISAAEALARPAMVAVLVLLIGPTPQAVLLGYATGASAIFIIALAVLRREGVADAPNGGGLPTVTRDPLAREIWQYALPLFPMAVVGWVTGISDRYILGLFLGTAQVGIYTTTYGLMSQPFLITMAIIGRTMSPIYNKAVANGNDDLARRTFRAWFWGTAAVCGSGFVAVVILRHWIARFLLAEEYRPGAELMPWIAAGYALYAIGCMFESRLYARKLTGRLLLGNVIVAVAAVIVPVAFLYKWGMLGVAAACPVYFLVQVLVMWRLSRVRPAGAADGQA